MGVWEVLSIFFLFSALQPMFRQRMLDRSRGNLLREIERQRKSRVIALVHRQERCTQFREEVRPDTLIRRQRVSGDEGASHRITAELTVGVHRPDLAREQRQVGQAREGAFLARGLAHFGVDERQGDVAETQPVGDLRARGHPAPVRLLAQLEHSPARRGPGHAAGRGCRRVRDARR